MSSMPHTRVVLRGKAAKEDFAELAYFQDWVIDEIVPASDEEPYEEVWITTDGNTEAHLIDDHLIGLVYVDVVGQHRDNVVALIRSRLDNYSREEVIDAARSAGDPQELDRVVRLAGAVATEGFDKDLFEIFRRALESEDPQTRIAAIITAGYTEWHEFIPLIGRLARGDPDQVVRDTAASISEGFHRVLGDEQP
jgi:hypothetical protein